jgi:DNA-binding NtrC family response regulator
MDAFKCVGPKARGPTGNFALGGREKGRHFDESQLQRFGMTRALMAVRNAQLAKSITEACRDRGVEFDVADDFHSAVAALKADQDGLYVALVMDIGDLGSKSEKKLCAVLETIPADRKVMALGSGFSLKNVTAFYRAGLTDYLTLPLEPIELSRALNNVFGSFADRAESAKPVKAGDPAKGTARSAQAKTAGSPTGSQAVLPARERIVGRSPELMKVFRIVEKVAATDSTVMIHGESGTGKELIARAIHASSPRSDRPLIPVNCGAIPEELLETELFGHEKGAFTNAIRDRMGRFELADGGTIFLDEIGDMSPKLQVKLLRVIQEHEFERVGGDKTISVDIRIITATHVDLTRAVEDGRFREDLYYRLNVIPLTVPPLRDRAADIPLLVNYFLQRLKETRGSQVTGLDSEALSALCLYRWPGNIRELENLMERMVILAEGPRLTCQDLPSRLREAAKIERLAEVRPNGGTATRQAQPPDEQAVRPPFQDSDHPQPAQEDLRHNPLAAADFEAELNDADNPEGQPQEIGFGGFPASPQIEQRPDDTPSSPETASLPAELKRLLEPLLSFPPQGVNLDALVSKYEDLLITAALNASGGVKNQAARILSVNRSTFMERLKKKGFQTE